MPKYVPFFRKSASDTLKPRPYAIHYRMGNDVCVTAAIALGADTALAMMTTLDRIGATDIMLCHDLRGYDACH